MTCKGTECQKYGWGKFDASKLQKSADTFVNLNGEVEKGLSVVTTPNIDLS